MLNRETFFDNLKSQFKDDIRMIVIETENKKTERFNMNALMDKLAHLQELAIENGISESEWMELVYDTSPEVYDKVYRPQMAA